MTAAEERIELINRMIDGTITKTGSKRSGCTRRKVWEEAFAI